MKRTVRVYKVELKEQFEDGPQWLEINFRCTNNSGVINVYPAGMEGKFTSENLAAILAKRGIGSQFVVEFTEVEVEQEEPISFNEGTDELPAELAQEID